MQTPTGSDAVQKPLDSVNQDPVQLLNFLQSLGPAAFQALLATAAASAGATAPANNVIDVDAPVPAKDVIDVDAPAQPDTIKDDDGPLFQRDQILPGPPPAAKLSITGASPSITLIRILTGNLTNPSTAMAAGARDASLRGIEVSSGLIANRTERGNLAVNKSRLWTDFKAATGRSLYPERLVDDQLSFVDKCLHPEFRQLNGLFDGDVPIGDILASFDEGFEEPPAPPTARPRGRPRKSQPAKDNDESANDDDDDDDDNDQQQAKSKAKGKGKATKDDDGDYADDADQQSKTKASAKGKRKATKDNDNVEDKNRSKPKPRVKAA